MASWPKQEIFDQKYLHQAQHTFELINRLRHITSQHSYTKNTLTLYVKNNKPTWLTHFEPYIKKATGITNIHQTKTQHSAPFVIAQSTFYLPHTNQNNTQAKRTDLMKQLVYTQGFLLKIEKKLTNHRFLEHAPKHLIDYEKKKRTDAREKIKVLQNLLKNLSSS